jgi:hypothetical protein
MHAQGAGGRVHVERCAVCSGCGRCRWVATGAKASHVIEVKVKVRHFCQHHGIEAPTSFVFGIADGSWFTEPELPLVTRASGRKVDP